VFLNSYKGVSTQAVVEGIKSIGADIQTVVIMDSNSLFLTANCDTIYALSYLDLTKGPMVYEVPPGALGAIDDMWFQWVIDLGIPARIAGGAASTRFCRRAMMGWCRTAATALRARRPHV
jgi:hypothetical protein